MISPDSASAIDLIDTHCHFNHEKFASEGGVNEVEAAIARASEAGVNRMLVVGFDLDSSQLAVDLANQYSCLYAAVGIHPHDSKHYDSASEDKLKEWAQDPRVVAIGEIGLDYHYDFSPREAQYAAFRAQLRVAEETGLPIILHCREAYADLLDLLEDSKPPEVNAVMHCWAGTPEEASRAVELGCYLGFGGVLTFKNADINRDSARLAPLDRLLVETDAPYLAPVPYRGKRNEPAYTRLVAEKLAEIREIPLDELAKASTQNAGKIFLRLLY
jgi:TatD DNase family protein